MMRLTWVFAVATLTYSSSAISALERPRAIWVSTSSSRSVSRSSSAGRRPLGVGPGGELGDQLAGDARREEGVAGGDDPHAGEQVLGRRVLEQEAAGPGPQRAVDVLVEVEGREDQDAGVGQAGVGR